MTAWRDALLEQRNGFGASVTGGAAAASPTVVTTLADSGPGSLREALQISGPAWIEFGVTGTIALLSPIQIAPHKTIDGRSADITITDHGLYYSGALHGATANLIIAYLTLDHAQTNANDDAIQIDGGGIGADLGWVHHCTLRDGTDGLIDIVDVGGNPAPWTVDWCRLGPHPGPKAAASGHTDGKLCLCGRDDDVGSAGGIRVTWHHNYAFNCNSRQPRAQAALVHAYNCVTKFWGNTDAKNSTAMACATEGQVLAEGNIFEPYNDGDDHWLGGTVVTADKDAMRLELPGVGTEGVK